VDLRSVKPLDTDTVVASWPVPAGSCASARLAWAGHRELIARVSAEGFNLLDAPRND